MLTTPVAPIQKGNVPPGTTVNVVGAIVTAVGPTHGVDTNFWIQDLGGGQYSGIQVYDKNGVTPKGIAIGDTVTVVGTFQPYNGPASNPWTLAENEIILISVVATAHGATPVASTVSDLSQFTPTAGKVWDGCLLKIPGTTVSSVGIGYGQYAVADSAGNAVGVDWAISNTFEPRLEGETMTSLTGVLEASYNYFNVEPRLLTDAVGTGTNTPLTVAISDVQDATSANHPTRGQLVTFTAPIVSAVAPYTWGTSTQKNFWIQTAAAASGYNGVFVEDYYYLNPTVTAGDTRTVTGKYVALGNGMLGTGINIADAIILFPDHPVGPATSSGTAVTPISLALSTLKGAGQEYDGCFVQLDDASISVSNLNPDAPKDYGEYQVQNAAGTDTVRIDDMMASTRTGMSTGSTLSTVRGMFYKGSGVWRIEPRMAADIAQ